MLKKTFIVYTLILSLLATDVCAKEQTKEEQVNTYELLNLFGEVMERTKMSYVEDVTDKQLIEAAINGMLTSLDPHSSYLTVDDFKYMKQLKATIKLLGMSRYEDGKYFAMVAPFVLTKESPLYNVSDVMNAILVTGNTLGDSMFYGAGAGKLPTASAVVSDVIECAMNPGKTIKGTWKPDKLELSDLSDAKRRFFVRIANANEEAVKVAFGHVQMLEPVCDGEAAFVTDVMTERSYQDIASAFDVVNMIRMDS